MNCKHKNLIWLIFLILRLEFYGNCLRLRSNLSLKVKNTMKSQIFSKEKLVELKNTPDMRSFMSKVIGDDNWDELVGNLKLLGPQWTSRILGIVDNLPQDKKAPIYYDYKINDISNEFTKFKTAKQKMDEEIGEEKAELKKEFQTEDFDKTLNMLENQFGFNVTQISNDAIYKKKFTEYSADELLSKQREEVAKESQRFIQESSQFQEKMKLLPSFDEMYDEVKVNPDKDPPEPNTKDAGPACYNQGDCKTFSFMIMKCGVIRVNMRMIYEILCGFINFFTSIIMKLCACTAEKKPPYYDDQWEMTCNNKSSWPGLVCTIPFEFAVSLYGIVSGIWKIIIVFSTICMIPVGPLQMSSP